MSLSHWDKLPKELKVYIYTYSPEHKVKLNKCINDLHKVFHKKKFSIVMSDFLDEWYDEDGYLNDCDNEYCEKRIQKGNEIWDSIIGNDYCFCCDYCLSEGSTWIRYDYRKYYSRRSN